MNRNHQEISHKFGMAIKTSSFVLLVCLFALFGQKEAKASLAISPYNEPTNLKTGLVGHWTFDSRDLKTNVADSSGSGNNGYLQNFGATSSAVVVGKLGQGLKFDGVNTYVSTTDTSETYYSNTTFTITGWLRTTRNGSGTTLVSKNGSNGGFYINVGAVNTNKISVVYKSAGGGSAIYRGGSTVVNDGRWHHFTAILTTNSTDAGSNDIHIYTDGIQGEGSLTISSAYVPASTQVIRIGNVLSGTPFLGDIDDVRVYNRALSASEIKQLYNMSAGSKMNATAPQSSFGLDMGLVGHWTFDSKDLKTNVADSSGQGNNGTLQGFGATSSAVVVGKLGQGLKFDGNGNYADLGNVSAIDNAIQASWSFWIKQPTLSYSSYILDKYDSNYLDASWGIRLAPSAFGIGKDEIVMVFGSNIYCFTTGNVFSSNNWYHVTFLFDGSRTVDKLSLYIDGLPESISCVGSLPGSLASAARTVKVGAESYGSGGVRNFFAGYIDDIRIYNRTLSASEIQQLYNQGAGSKVNATLPKSSSGLDSGLVGHWTFDSKDLKTNVADTSGQGNNGYLQNFGATSSAVTIGKLGQGLKFDGVDDYVTIPNILGTGSITTCSWFNLRTVNNGWSNIIYSSKYLFGPYSSGSKLILSTNSGSGGSYIFSTAILETNKWMHTCGVVNGNNEASIYINGDLNAGPTAVTAPTSSILTRIGYASAVYFPGSLDDVRIYSRALSATEVKQLYSMGR